MAERIAIADMFKNQSKTEVVLEATDVASSTWYESKKIKDTDKRKFNKGRPRTTKTELVLGGSISDAVVVEKLKELRSRPHFQNGGGYQKMVHYLRRELNCIIGPKKTYRLCKEAKVLLPMKKKNPKKANYVSQNRTINKPFSLWELDIKYCYIHGENRFFYLMAIIDVYMRYIVGYHLGLNCLGRDLVNTLSIAMASFNSHIDGLTVRMDNGPQMKSKQLLAYAKANEGRLIQEFIPPSTPNKNAHIESFNSIFEIEFLQVHYIPNFTFGYSESVKFLNFYNQNRVHGSLNFQTPQEVLEKYKTGHPLNIKEVRL